MHLRASDRAGGAAQHQFGFDHDVHGDVRLALEARDQELDGFRRHGLDRLAHRAQRGPDLTGQRYVIEAHHRQAAGNRYAEFQRGAHDACRHVVVGRENGGRRIGQRQQGGADLLKRPRFGFGALCIFLYVGAEVSIGSLIVNYLMQPGVMGLQEQAAGKLIGLYWGGAMVGRFIGSALLRVVSPGKVLACVAVGAIALIALSTNTTGMLSGYSLLAIGLMNAIMFPTIFSLACEKLGSRAADGSGIINVAIFGGAVIPLLTGVIADVSGSLSFALILPAACYAIIAGFGIYARKPAVA